MSGHPPSDADAVASNDRSAAAADGSARKREALELFSELPRHYDLLSSALSFGQDPRWRRALVRALAPTPGARVLDVATGTGMVAAELLARTDCTVVGIDQSAQMLGAARTRFAGNARVELLEGQAEALPFEDHSFDALTFTYLLRYVDDPPATMHELARVVRPGGRVASLEFGVPPWRPAYWAWRFYTAVGLPTLGRLASREWGEVGRFLGPSIRGFYAHHPLQRIAGYWREAGLIDVNVRRMSLGGGVVIWATRGVDLPSPREASARLDVREAGTGQARTGQARTGQASAGEASTGQASAGEAGDARGA